MKELIKLLNKTGTMRHACGVPFTVQIDDADIAERLCSPSELKKTRNGERAPNSRETWLDCQARALRQAFWLIQTKASF